MIYNGNDLSDLNRIVKRAKRELSENANPAKYDFIAVRGMSGALVGSPLSLAVKKPLVVVRKPTELQNSHGYKLLGGGQGSLGNDILNLGQRFIFLDDFISTGATKNYVLDEIPKRCHHVGDYLYEPTDKSQRLRWNADKPEMPRQDRIVKRIDPIDCGCTDCIVGYSIPLGIASDSQINAMINGITIDATALTEFDFDVYMRDR